MRNQSGFSLTELMITMAISGMLMTIAAPNFDQYLKRSKVRRAEAEIAGINVKIMSYHALLGFYPSTHLPGAIQPWIGTKGTWMGQQNGANCDSLNDPLRPENQDAIRDICRDVSKIPPTTPDVDYCGGDPYLMGYIYAGDINDGYKISLFCGQSAFMSKMLDPKFSNPINFGIWGGPQGNIFN